MNSISRVVLFLVLVATTRSETVESKDIGGSIEIIGRLGVPLGTVVSIEATVVSESKVWPGMRFLRVESVNGVPCEPAPVMNFYVQLGPEQDSEPRDPEEAKRRSKRLQMKSPQHAPTGTKFTFFAFEKGHTPANPKSKPDEAPFDFIQDIPDPEREPNTYFITYLIVVAPDAVQPVTTDKRSAEDR